MSLVGGISALGSQRLTLLVLLVVFFCFMQVNEQPSVTLEKDNEKNRTLLSSAEAKPVVNSPAPVLLTSSTPAANPSYQSQNNNNKTGYKPLVHQRCQCKQPFIDQYESIMAKNTTTTNEEVKAFNARELSLLRMSVQQFLQRWFEEVLSYRRRSKSNNSTTQEEEQQSARTSAEGPPPEARLLFVGDSLARNMFYSIVVQTVDERIREGDPVSTFARRVVEQGGDTYQTLYLTWPDTRQAQVRHSKKNLKATNMAVIKIRYENNAYFGMDTHSLKSSRALEFNPTHVFVSRGLWDVLRVRPFDPAVPLSAMSAGLVRLRKELQEYREKLSPKQRNLYPPTRVVYWAMPKLFASWESHCNHCEYDQDQGYFRDALYAAVRRANGALLHLHGQENFDSVAIELFDYYAMSKAAGARDTLHGDCIHPTHGQRRAILAQMLDLVSQPPRSHESVQQLVDDAQANNRVFLNATMYIPPPLVVRSGSSDSSSSCPLSFTLTDLDTIISPPLLTGTAAVSALADGLEDLTPPPLKRILNENGTELFRSMVTCPAPESMKWETVRETEVARLELQKVGGKAGGEKKRAGRSIVGLRRSEYMSACSNMIYSWLLGHGSTLPLFTEAKEVPVLVPNITLQEFLWAGNQCLGFMNRQVATIGRNAFYNQLWDYTDHYKLKCAVPPLVAWSLMQPVHSSLTGGGFWGGDLVICSLAHGGMRIRP